MDVLVQLASAPPDLPGLPSELAEIVAACLERDPRNRPTSASVVARLAPELAAGDELGSPPLAAAALTLIEEYRRIPRSSPDPDGNELAGDDDTIGSQPLGGLAGRLGPGGSLGGVRQVRRSGVPARRRVLLGAGSVAVAAALVAAGWVGATSARGKPVTAGRPVIELGPELGPPPGGPPLSNGLGPGIGQLPASPGPPVMGVSQPIGDGDTGFVIHGQAWPPGEPVRIDLIGHGSSPIRPIADKHGMFNYVINQNHEFFAAGLPAGVYTVRVVGTDGKTATARFEVIG